MIRRLFFVFLSFILSQSFAEGTRELMNNNCNNHGYIQIWDNNDPLRNFATYNCPEYARLYIRVAGGERIHMGFHIVQNSNSNTIMNDVWMRLRDPNGNIVLGPINIKSTMGSGWINTCNQALIGPASLYAGGYNDLVYNVPIGSDGDYYIEFAVNNNPNLYQSRIFRWFDITVSRWNGSNWVEKKGRLWSRKWDFTTRGANNQFVGTLYTYSNDSVVTSFNFNGMRPWGFEVSCNSFGASTVGTPQQRRRSDYRQNIINNGGIPAAPEYPIFLNDPDIEYYPTGAVGSVDSFAVIPCTQNSYCIYVSLTKPGSVSVTLNFPAPYTPRTFIQNLNAGPNCIPWDGRDGNGTPIPNNTVVNAVLDFYTGLTHLPLIDVEHHSNGFKVFLVRPTHRPNNTPLPDPKIYWDDILLTDPFNSLDGVQNLSGCTPTPTLGCHRWQNRGTNNLNPEVINTWWYTNSEQHTFVLDIDPNKWRIFPEIITCTGQNGVEVKFKFWHEIPFSSITWDISTNPPNLLGQASDTVIDNSDPEWTIVYLTFPVINNGNAVVISFQVSASSTKYPYCNENDTLICAVLPIIWNTPLSGTSKNGYNVLSWSTAVEQNIDGFWIERSKDGISFYTIGYVKSKGIMAEYTYEDKDLFGSDRWFYRLRVDENSSQVIYSNTVEIISKSNEYFNVIYNSNTNSLIIETYDNSINGEVTIIDVNGRAVLNAVTNERTLNVHLSSGVYIVRYNRFVKRICVF